MISSLSGRLVQKNPTFLVIDVNGIGFGVNIALSSYERIGSVGSEVHLLTYLHVREDILQLYGFTSEDERKLFQMLISISGVGPKLAQSILSSISVEDFRDAVSTDNVDALTAISGIGRKTAQRLIIELKEKFGDVRDSLSVIPAAGGGESPLYEEAVLALVSLGFKKPKAKAAVEKVLEGDDTSLPVEEVIKRALRHT